MKTIIDSHIHLDLIAHRHPDKIQGLKENRCGVVSWAYVDKADSISALKAGLAAHAGCVRRLSTKGLVSLYLTGIHPRSIPPDLTSGHIRSILEPDLNAPLCRGIGEIGLETGNSMEQAFFITQLELARTLLNPGQIIGVHTPRSNKPSITQIILSILDSFQDLSATIVVDHCNMETIDQVLEAGFMAGVTLNPAKTSWDELKDIVARHADQIGRIMCNTDSGGEFYNDVIRLSRNDELPEMIRDQIFHLNAARFFSIQ
jgi:predicted metal-dependent TIM-barrel fold hydrolase